MKKIYVTFKEGEIYKISSAEQFVKNFNSSGIFEIYEDLDFTDLKWPNYVVQTFNGKITGIGGVKKFSNVNATFSSTTSNVGGLFGAIGVSAVIKDINFENATVSFSNQGQSLGSVETYFGLLAGRIEETEENGVTQRADISGVTVSGKLRLGNVLMRKEYGVNLVANGDLTGITVAGIELYVFGMTLRTGYRYYIAPDEVTVDENYSLSLTFPDYLTLDEAEYKINY